MQMVIEFCCVTVDTTKVGDAISMNMNVMMRSSVQALGGTTHRFLFIWPSCLVDGGFLLFFFVHLLKNNSAGIYVLCKFSINIDYFGNRTTCDRYERYLWQVCS